MDEEVVMMKGGLAGIISLCLCIRLFMYPCLCLCLLVGKMVGEEVVMMKGGLAGIIRHLYGRPVPPRPRMTAQHLEPDGRGDRTTMMMHICFDGTTLQYLNSFSPGLPV